MEHNNKDILRILNGAMQIKLQQTLFSEIHQVLYCHDHAQGDIRVVGDCETCYGPGTMRV